MSSATKTARQFDRIPEELKADASWVLWKYERRREKPDKLTKVLYQVSGRYADSTRPATWTTFEAAVEAYKRGGFDGIGLVFHPENPYCGADIDDVTEIEAQHWIDRFDSYTECSPSGNGFHIICQAEVPKGTNRSEGELYSSGRFFTMTGDIVRDAPIREAQDAADEFYRFLRRGDGAPAERSASTPALTDAAVVRLAENAKHGDTFSAIYRGSGHFKSGSERDLSLASRLVFWTQDEAQIERIMRGSGCVREKWDKHRTYLKDTIAKALDGLTETYTPSGGARLRSGASSADPRPEKTAGDVVHLSFNGRGTTRTPHAYNLTDLGNSERFVADHGEDVRYCYPWGKWLVWSGARWERDDSGRVHRLAKETVRGIYREASDAEEDGRRKELAKHATRSEAEAKIRAMLELAKSERPVSPDDLDADPWLLNSANGTIDLRSGELRDHRREDLITRLAPVRYDPGATAPTWEGFLERVLPGEDLRAFVRRASGYSATGDTSEQCMFINHGTGNNGKSTFQEALTGALGDYAMRAPTEMLMAKRSGGVPNDVARLKGARFVTASETEEGRRLAESLVKDLTGQDTISARFMKAEWFDFKPSHKLWLSTNHKPEIRGTDNAIWRRIRLIPWAVTVPPAERDRKLPERLRDELPGVLAWVIRGCIEWHSEGLQAPDEVRRATSEYRAEMDVLRDFFAERCVVAEDAWAMADELLAAYDRWRLPNNERELTRTKFGRMLVERGFAKGRIKRGPDKGRTYYAGIGLAADRTPPDGGPNPSLGEGLVENPSLDKTPVNQRENGDTSEVVKSSEAVSRLQPENSLASDNVQKPFTTLHSSQTLHSDSGEDGAETNSQTHHDPEAWDPDAGEDLEGLEGLFGDEEDRRG